MLSNILGAFGTSSKPSNYPPPPPPKLCSNFSLLALCLIALAAIFIAPGPAQAQLTAAPAPNNFRVLELSASNIVLAADDVANLSDTTLRRQHNKGWVPLSKAIHHDVSTSSGTVKFTLRQGMRDFVYAPGKTTNFQLGFFVTTVHARSPWVTLSVHIPPAAPSSLSATAAQTSLTLSWTNPSSDSAVSAEVQIRPAGGSWPQDWTASASATSHSFSGLTADSNYEMRVRAKNSATDPGPDASLSKRTLAAVPTNFRVRALSPDRIVLVFNNVGTGGGIAGIVLERQSRENPAVWVEASVSLYTENGRERGLHLSPSEEKIVYAGGTTQYRVRVGSSDYAYLSVTVPPTRSRPTPTPTSTPMPTPTPTSTPTTAPARTGSRTINVPSPITSTPVSVPTSTPTTAPTQTSVRTAAITRPIVNAPPVDPPVVDDPPAQDSGDSQERRRASSSSQKATPTPRATQGFYQTLNNLPPGIEVNNWMMGAQGRRVGALGVGNQAIIDQGLLDAIDLWGYITPGIEVCFAQFGRLLLLDAAYAPRRVVPLNAYQRDGMTCATIDRAGTVVLLRSAAPLPDASGMAPLQNCMVYLQYALNFRAAPPDGNIMGILPAFIWLTALDYREGWYKVDYYGQQGWINADYVEAQGDCGL